MRKSRKARKALFMLITGLSSAQLCLGMENKLPQVGEKTNIELIHIPTEDELYKFVNEFMAISFQDICENIEKDLKSKGVEPNCDNILKELRYNCNNLNITDSTIIEMSKKYKAWNCKVTFEYFRKFLKENNIQCLEWIRFKEGGTDNHVAAVCLCRRKDGTLNLVCLNTFSAKIKDCNIPKLICKIDDIVSYTFKNNKSGLTLFLVPCNLDEVRKNKSMMEYIKDHYGLHGLCDDEFPVRKFKPSEWVQLMYCWSLQNNKSGFVLSSEFTTDELLVLAEGTCSVDNFYDSGLIVNNF